MRQVFIFICIGLTFGNLDAYSQHPIDYQPSEEINIKEFNSLISDGIRRLLCADSLKDSTYIALAKLYNSLVLAREQTDLHVLFDELFSERIEFLVKHFEAVSSKGQGYYSPKFDLWIGGSPPIRKLYKIKY